MIVSKNFQTIDNKIEQNKAEYNIDRQTTKISAFSSGNVCKYEFLIGEDVLREDLLEKAATVKRFEYLPWRSELEKQTHIAKDQYKRYKEQKIILMMANQKMMQKEKMKIWVVKVILLKILMQY